MHDQERDMETRQSLQQPRDAAEPHDLLTPPAGRAETPAEGIRAYLRKMADAPLPSPDEEVALCRRITVAHGQLVAALLAVPAAAHRLRGLCGAAPDEGPIAHDPASPAQDVVERLGRLARARCQTAALARVDAAIGDRLVDPAERPRVLVSIERIVSAMPVRSTFVEELAADIVATSDADSTEHVGLRLQELRDLKQRFIDDNLPLVVSIAAKYVGRDVPLAKLVQGGNRALVQAADRFDYRDGFEFSRYATWWIRQAMRTAIRRREPERDAF
jgi:DNA-directed RNA polymerase sigma subunit (sigma70/sigma32)